MSSIGNGSSATSYMHSCSTTRTSTRTNTAASSLLPPMSEKGGSRYPKPGFTELHRLDTRRTNTSAPISRSGSPRSAVGKRSPGARSPLEHGPEPFEEYCSPTRSATSGLNNLQRHRSTKQLIDRFEILEVAAAPSRAARSSARNSIHEPIRPAEATVPHPTTMKNRKASPVRHSFRNFLSVFGKGRASNKPDSFPTNPANIISLNTPPIPPVDTLAVHNQIAPNLATENIACTTPIAIQTGPLLYLSQYSTTQTAPVLPIWTSCTVTLHRRHLLVTSLSSQDNPSTRMIDLTNCTDVRSLAISDIGPDERALLPSYHAMEDIKIFEIHLDGLPKATFAATSIQQRAGWVTGIWFVLCPLYCSMYQSDYSSIGMPSSRFEKKGASGLFRNTRTTPRYRDA